MAEGTALVFRQTWVGNPSPYLPVLGLGKSLSKTTKLQLVSQ